MSTQIHHLRIAARISARNKLPGSVQVDYTVHRLKDGTPVFETGPKQGYKYLMPDGKEFADAFPDGDLDTDLVDIKLKVTGHVEPSDPSVGILSASIDDVEAETNSGQPFELTDTEEKQVTQLLLERLDEYDGDHFDDWDR